jgi:hypothetical protein
VWCTSVPHGSSGVVHQCTIYSETSLNQTLCNLEPFLKWLCRKIMFSIFAIHTEPLQSGNCSKLNLFFGAKCVRYREVPLYICTYIDRENPAKFCSTQSSTSTQTVAVCTNCPGVPVGNRKYCPPAYGNYRTSLIYS